jgi:hypothetical protein
MLIHNKGVGCEGLLFARDIEMGSGENPHRSSTRHVSISQMISIV